MWEVCPIHLFLREVDDISVDSDLESLGTRTSEIACMYAMLAV